jgi:hypothetical protein
VHRSYMSRMSTVHNTPRMSQAAEAYKLYDVLQQPAIVTMRMVLLAGAETSGIRAPQPHRIRVLASTKSLTQEPS